TSLRTDFASSTSGRVPKRRRKFLCGARRDQSGAIGSHASVPRAWIAPTARARPEMPSTTGATAARTIQPNSCSQAAIASRSAGGTGAVPKLPPTSAARSRPRARPPKWTTPAAPRSTNAVPTSALLAICPFRRASSRRLGVGASVLSWNDSSAISTPSQRLDQARRQSLVDARPARDERRQERQRQGEHEQPDPDLDRERHQQHVELRSRLVQDPER